jgi:molybdenum-dependent DNA-binding transcriptional regulator ModE
LNGLEFFIGKEHAHQCLSQGNQPITQKQQDLIQQVVEEGQSIVKTAKKLKLKYSRAKLIVKYYKETGQIMPESKPRTNSKSTR